MIRVLLVKKVVFHFTPRYRSALCKQSTNKDEHQDKEDEVVVENMVEEANEESLQAFEDECASPCSAVSFLHSPSLYAPANSSPSSNACSAFPRALWQTNICDEKEENIHEIISSRSSTSASTSLFNPAGSPKLSDEKPTSALLTITEIQENSICCKSETSRLTITDSSSSSITVFQELTNGVSEEAAEVAASQFENLMEVDQVAVVENVNEKTSYTLPESLFSWQKRSDTVVLSKTTTSREEQKGKAMMQESVSTSISSSSDSSLGETETNSSCVIATTTLSGAIGATSAKIDYATMKDMLPTFTYNETVISKQELCSGSYGRVYIAITRLGKLAVKTLKIERMATLTQAEVNIHINLLYEEAKLLYDLKHPNILSLYMMISDFENSFPGMATELMSENSLYHCLARGDQRVRSWAGILSVAGQVVDAMVYLHDDHCSVVHFDLKSCNILVEYSSLNPNNPICRVGDFGLAVVKKLEAPYNGRIPLIHSRGTVIYMAPEVILAKYRTNQSVTDKVDVYSFGLLMWELVMGVTPYNGMTTEQVEMNVLTYGLRPDLPAGCIWGWNELMEACWAQDENRRPTFQEIRAQLDRIIMQYNNNLIMNGRP